MPPGAVERTGFGRALIQHSLQSALHATTDLVFGKEGVSCRIDLPLGTAAPTAKA